MSLLLKEYKEIQEKAFQERYTILKREFLEQVAKNPFDDVYYVGSNIPSQVAKHMIQFFLVDGFESKLIYEDEL